MTETTPTPPPEDILRALSVIEPDLDPVFMKPESADIDDLLLQASSITPDEEVREAYNEARRRFNEARGDDPDVIPYSENRRFVRQAMALSRGDENVLDLLVSAYETGNYDYLVKLTAGWNYLADQMSKTQGGVAPQGAQGEQLQEILSMLLGQNQSSGEGMGAIGSPKMYGNLGDTMLDEASQMEDGAFKNGANYGERDEKGKLKRKKRRQPVELVVPQGPDAGFDFASQFSDRNPSNLTPEEKRGLNRLLRQIQLWTFNVDTFTRVGVYQQLSQVLATTTENKGLDMPDMLGRLPRAIGAVMGFAHALHGGTEKAAGEIGGRAPSPLDVESIERMMYRELVVKARDPKTETIRTVTVPLSTSRMRDVIVGNTAEQMRQTEPLFVDKTYRRGKPFSLLDIFSDTRLTALNRLEILKRSDQTMGKPLDWKISHPEVNSGTPTDIFQFIEPEVAKGIPTQESIQRIERIFGEARAQGNIDLGDALFPIGRNKINNAVETYSLKQHFLRDDLSIKDRGKLARLEVLLIGNGVPLYLHPEINSGKPFAMHEVNAADASKLSDGFVEMYVDGDLGPLYANYSEAEEAARDGLRAMFGEQWQTTENMLRLLAGKELLLDDIAVQLEQELARYGLSLDDIVGFEHEAADATEWNVNNDRVKDVYEAKKWELSKGKELTPEQEAEAKLSRTYYMLGELIYVRYGMINNLAFDTAEVMQLSPQWDPAQLTDHLAELWIKAFGAEEYAEKYGLNPAVLRPVLRTFLKPLIGWKMKNVDAVIIAMSGDVAQSRWNNPLAPDKTEVIPQLFNENNGVLATLSEGQKQLIEAILYDRTPHRMQNSRQHRANRIRQLTEEMIQTTDSAKRKQLQDAIDQISQKYLDSYLSEYEKLSPQAMPRSRNDSIALVNGMSQKQRAKINNVNFKDLLRNLGYDQMRLSDEEYRGWYGLSKVIEIRSSRHFLLGRLEDKLFKNEGKYPEMATFKAAAELIVGINQSLDPWIFRYLGGKPDNLGGFTPDSAIEGLFKGVVDLAFFYGKRTPKEAQEYLNQIFEPLATIVKSMGYIDQKSSRYLAKELLLWVASRTRIDDRMPNYDFVDGEGEHGTQRKRIEISLTPPSTENEAIASWAKATLLGIRAQRRQGNRVVFPDNADLADFNRWASHHPNFNKALLEKPKGRETQLARIIRLGKIRHEAQRLGYKLKNPYVVIANTPAYKYDVTVDAEGQPDSVKVTGTGLARYEHRGGDPLLLTALVKMAMDAQLIDATDARSVIETLKKQVDKPNHWWNRLFNLAKEGKDPDDVFKTELEALGINYQPMGPTSTSTGSTASSSTTT